MRFLILLAALGTAAAAEAQIRLPAAPVPLPSLPQTLGAPDPRHSDPADLRALTQLRRQAIVRLIRGNRRLIEAGPDGEPIVRGAILALGVEGEASRRRWMDRGFTIERTQAIASDLQVVLLKAPERLSTPAALQELRETDPQGTYDYDHIFLGGGVLPLPGREHAEAGAPPMGTASSMGAAPPGEAPPLAVRVGLLDSGVDAAHPAFRGSHIHPWGCAGRPVPGAHGTAVASLLVLHGGTELYAADVYCGEPTGGSADLIAAALGWMAQERVAVINVSLVGPKNLLLERVVAALIARGHVIVAAVGNDGPAAPPLYPAAYPDVVGVTAVDAQRRVLLEAERGPQVMFAALGSDLQAARIGHGYIAVRGTSFAAPSVAALLAPMVPAPDRQSSADALQALAMRAVHLGAPGRDLTYGFGLVGADIR